MQALEFEIAATIRERFNSGQRMGVVRRELRIDRLTRVKHRARASDVRYVRRLLAREHGIIDKPRFLPALDLGIPIRAFHEPNGNTPVLPSRKLGDPRDHRQRALLIGLHGKPQTIPGLQFARGTQRLEHVEHEIEAIGFFRIDGEAEPHTRGLRRQQHERRQQLGHHTLALHPFITRMQRRQFDRDAWPLKNRDARCLFSDYGNRIAIRFQISRRISARIRRLTEHIEGITAALCDVAFRILQRLIDRPSKDELAAEDAHRISHGLPDHRLTRTRHRAFATRRRNPTGSSRPA